MYVCVTDSSNELTFVFMIHKGEDEEKKFFAIKQFVSVCSNVGITEKTKLLCSGFSFIIYYN